MVLWHRVPVGVRGGGGELEGEAHLLAGAGGDGGAGQAGDAPLGVEAAGGHPQRLGRFGQDDEQRAGQGRIGEALLGRARAGRVVDLHRQRRGGRIAGAEGHLDPHRRRRAPARGQEGAGQDQPPHRTMISRLARRVLRRPHRIAVVPAPPSAGRNSPG
jgi:hypothetical protein